MVIHIVICDIWGDMEVGLDDIKDYLEEFFNDHVVAVSEAEVSLDSKEGNDFNVVWVMTDSEEFVHDWLDDFVDFVVGDSERTRVLLSFYEEIFVLCPN